MCTVEMKEAQEGQSNVIHTDTGTPSIQLRTEVHVVISKQDI